MAIEQSVKSLSPNMRAARRVDGNMSSLTGQYSKQSIVVKHLACFLLGKLSLPPLPSHAFQFAGPLRFVPYHSYCVLACVRSLLTCPR